MKIIHVNFHGTHNGSGIAANRINLSLRKFGINSEMWVARNPGSKEGIYCIKGIFFQKIDSLKNIIIQRVSHFMKFEDGRSYNLIPSRLVHQLNESDADVIHLHWINAEMISIAQLANIKKPVVWTLHDMWAFCGGEHYTTDRRYVSGYQKSANHYFDVDQWIFFRKKRLWKNWRPFIVTPSNWLKQCADESQLLGGLDTCVIPNCVDLEIFKPMNKIKCRYKYGLPSNKRIILFGAVNPDDTRKGGDLLSRALAILTKKSEYVIAIFGKQGSDSLREMETYWLGSISSESNLAEIYNCADVLCVPSRMDNLPNTAVEATACGIPIVAFNIGGLSDIIEHKMNGYLAAPFDPIDFANGIDWVLSELNVEKSSHSSIYIRNKAKASYNNTVVAKNYITVYNKAIHSRD